MGNVRVDTAEGLLVRKVRELGAQVIIRGIRDEADFAYEKQIAWANHELDEQIETVCPVRAGRLCGGIQQHHPRVRFLWRRHPAVMCRKTWRRR